MKPSSHLAASNEEQRLKSLHELFILDTAPEPVFDNIASLASEQCQAPIAMITLIDGHRQWFKATVGIGEVRETPLDVAFCAHTIRSSDMLVVPDLTNDPRFADNPFVTGEHGLRFYAAAPLVLPNGERVGALCVIDREPRELDARQMDALHALAGIVADTLEMRRSLMAKTAEAQAAAQKNLSDALMEMADLYENAPCGYHSLDAEGRFARINQAELRWLGCEMGEVVGKLRITDFLTAEGRDVFQREFPRLMRDGVLKDLEYDLVSRTGEVRRIASTATVITDAQGRPVATRTVSYDMTELHRTREALRVLTAQQQAILDTDLIGIVKIRGRTVVWANAGAEALLGYGSGELIGLPSRLFYPDEAAYRRGADMVPTGKAVAQSFSAQGEAARKSGERIWVDVRGRILPDEPDTVLCMLVDMTAARRSEQDRLHAVALESENRHLAEMNRVKGAFLSNMSHELRTPLNGVIGYTHLLLAGSVRPDSPKFNHYLAQIGTSGRHLLSLIETVLCFAEVDAGTVTLKSVRVAVRSTLQTVTEAMLNDGFAKGIYLSLEVDPSVDEVVIDETRLVQMVSHYVSNAIKFSEEGSTVTVRAWKQADGQLRIEVEDSGIGIAEADLPALFRPFRQLSEGRNKLYPGAGLGLALTRRLAELMGGAAGVQSRPGVGSVFWLTLPLITRLDTGD